MAFNVTPTSPGLHPRTIPAMLGWRRREGRWNVHSRPV